MSVQRRAGCTGGRREVGWRRAVERLAARSAVRLTRLRLAGLCSPSADEAMDDPVDGALAHVRGLTSDCTPSPVWPVTLNFHPDVLVHGTSVIEHLARDGVYRSQFETGTSNGGLSAFPGGERWAWESRIFGRAYDEASPALRPKYGALDHRQEAIGASPRFGSCHLRLRRHVLARTTFCYPDSHLQPQDFSVANGGALIALATENRRELDPLLDNYVEAHVHGELKLGEDVDAVVLDPSYRGTAAERAARDLGTRVEWHTGFRLHAHRRADCERFRGPAAAEALAAVAVDGVVTPALLGAARIRGLDRQTAKRLWHCMVRHGQGA